MRVRRDAHAKMLFETKIRLLERDSVRVRIWQQRQNTEEMQWLAELTRCRFESKNDCFNLLPPNSKPFGSWPLAYAELIRTSSRIHPQFFKVVSRRLMMFCIMIIGFDDVEIDFFFGACSEDEDGVPQGTFSPERIQDLYREARRLHFSSPRKDFLFIRGGAAAAPARLGCDEIEIELSFGVSSEEEYVEAEGTFSLE
ncbi:uncharacterized protein LOC135130348 [Zophobas morio]|uniref:uncharacterized protein LOC135130348 n=1 Tax=Zophobas morio TaxID=2755281 RepID=UPI0030837B98